MDKAVLRKKFAEEWQKHYKVETLIEKGYSRKQCKSCKTHFWTLDPDREICADSKCVGYGFIGKPTKRLGYTETWAEIAKYFKKQIHIIGFIKRHLPENHLFNCHKICLRYKK